MWKPGEHQLDQIKIRYTYVSTEGPAYKEHFGAKEHNYSHWLSLNHTAGWWDLARFLFVNPEAASSAKRDATPLRLLSWLSFRLEPSVDELIEATMIYLSTVDKVKDSDLLALGTTHLKMDTPFDSAETLRDHLIELSVSVLFVTAWFHLFGSTVFHLIHVTCEYGSGSSVRASQPFPLTGTSTGCLSPSRINR